MTNSPPIPQSLAIVGLSFIVAGLLIGSLSYPVSEASHAVADELKRHNPGKEGVRRLANNAARGGKLAEFAQARHDDNPVVKLFRIIVALFALLWCCCVCLLAGIAELTMEPLGQALGTAARFSVYTMAAVFVIYGLMHVAIGIRIMRGSPPSWGTRMVLLINGSQGMTLLGASIALWDAAAPFVGSVALGLGAGLLLWVGLAWWILFRRPTPQSA